MLDQPAFYARRRLIHLRYATVLHDRHMISFDGIHPSYGASSLLYVAILAALRSVTHSPLLPKWLSVIAYALLLWLCYRVSRSNRYGIALLVVLAGPFAVRWLTDGMETSLACLLAAIFALLVHRKANAAILGMTALVLTILRVDMALLIPFGALLLAKDREWKKAAYVCIGSAISVAFIQITMGHVLPDTAVAKTGLPFIGVFLVAAREVVATFAFGIGVILVWITTAVFAYRSQPQSAVIANLPFPILVLLAAIRGQQIHGIRYLIWALLFSIIWNLASFKPSSLRRSIPLYAFAGVMVLCWIKELPVAERIDRGRSSNLAAMENAHLERLHGEGIAGDVGFIGYFSRAPICDINGLVNGRKAAAMNTEERSAACVAAKPSFLFLSESQIRNLDEGDGLNSQQDWLKCGHVDFRNVSNSDRHWLLVRRSDYPKGCPTSI